MNGLNVNFNQTISKFESAMRKKMLIKSVFYKRVFGGKGFEFDSFRTYSYGDEDSSLIDWKATMKNGGIPLVRQYIEERDLNIFILIDVGDNMVFGSGNKLKVETAAEISAALSHLILTAGDKMGFALYSDKVSGLRPFSPGLEQFYAFLKTINKVSIYRGRSNLKNALGEIKPYLKKSSAVFILSDFIRLDEETLRHLKNFMHQHETVGVMIRDNVDTKLSDLKAEVVVEDIDTGEQILINPDLIKYEYERIADEQKFRIKELFRKNGADLVELSNNQDFVMPLVEFLRKRTKRRQLRRK